MLFLLCLEYKQAVQKNSLFIFFTLVGATDKNFVGLFIPGSAEQNR